MCFSVPKFVLIMCDFVFSDNHKRQQNSVDCTTHQVLHIADSVGFGVSPCSLDFAQGRFITYLDMFCVVPEYRKTDIINLSSFIYSFIFIIIYYMMSLFVSHCVMLDENFACPF